MRRVPGPSRLTAQLPQSPQLDIHIYLSSAELAAAMALLGRIPTVAEYMEQVQTVNAKAADVYRYMNFEQIAAFKEVADTVTV
jgi:aconitate hydratase 2/2-methylisocitrate dehydratase